MKIKNYKKLKNNTYQITFSDNSSIFLYDDTILKYNLLLKKEITKEELQVITKDNQTLTCYYMALKYLSNKNRCQKEIKTYLTKNHFSNQDIENTIQKLIEKKLLNDDLYLQAFINDQVNLTTNGPSKIINKLVNLGFTEEKIKDYLNTFPSELWQEKITKIITKKINSHQKEGSKKLKERLMYSCLYEGYEREDIISVLDTIKLPNNSTNLLNLAQKLYQKLSSKYQGPKLTYQLKNKLLYKGYTYEEIDNIIENIKK